MAPILVTAMPIAEHVRLAAADAAAHRECAPIQWSLAASIAESSTPRPRELPSEPQPPEEDEDVIVAKRRRPPHRGAD